MRAAAHARKLAIQRQKRAEEARKQREATATMVMVRADARASHKHKLWKALHANDDGLEITREKIETKSTPL